MYLEYSQVKGEELNFEIMSKLAFLTKDTTFGRFVAVSRGEEIISYLELNQSNQFEREFVAMKMLFCLVKEDLLLRKYADKLVEIAKEQLIQSEFKAYNLAEASSSKDSSPQKKEKETNTFFYTVSSFIHLLNNRVQIEEETLIEVNDAVLSVLSSMLNNKIEVDPQFEQLVKGIEQNVVFVCLNLAKSTLTAQDTDSGAFSFVVSFFLENAEKLLAFKGNYKEILLIVHEIAKFIYNSPMESYSEDTTTFISLGLAFSEQLRALDSKMEHFYFRLKTEEMLKYLQEKQLVLENI